jgi:hypothetical protein
VIQDGTYVLGKTDESVNRTSPLEKVVAVSGVASADETDVLFQCGGVATQNSPSSCGRYIRDGGRGSPDTHSAGDTGRRRQVVEAFALKARLRKV